jgi:hypothetical protein
MKLKLFFAVLLAFSTLVKAQEKCADIEKQLSQYSEELDYKKAYDSWREIYISCPKFSQKSYVLGNQILQYRVETSLGDDKLNAVKELAAFYDAFDKNFPENTNGNLVKKASLLYDTKIGSNDEVFALLDAALSKNTNQFTAPKPLFDYYYLLCENYKIKKATFNQVFDNYTKTLSVLEKNKNNYNPEEYATAKMAITNLLEQNLSAENLPVYIESQFENNKNNIDWLTNSGLLLMQKSPKNPILEKVALQIESIQPSFLSSQFLANYNLKNRKQPEAMSYFEKAVTLSQNPVEKADSAYKLATMLMTQDAAKAKQMMDIAIENAPNEGKYYVFLASLYENSISQCATNKEEQAAIYKLASQTVLQAEKVEPRYKTTAQNYSAQYLKKLNSVGKPKKKSVTLSCWINQTVQF